MRKWKGLISDKNIVDSYLLTIDQIYYSLSSILKKDFEYQHGAEFGLFGGKSGILLFLHYYNKLKDSTEVHLEIEDLFGKILIDIQTNSYATFANGVLGQLWALDLIENSDADRIFIPKDINDSILTFQNYARRLLQEGNYDYMHGAIGALLYIQKRGYTEVVKELIPYIKSSSTIDLASGGLKWYFPKNKKIIEGVVNLGLSHGTTSILAFLLKIRETGIQSEEIDNLILGIITYLIANKQDFEAIGSHFHYFIGEGEEHQPIRSRLAWCYGDLGISYTLLRASIVLNDKSLMEFALNVLLDCSNRRNLVVDQIYDATLCHGSCGAAHIFNRVYQITCNEEFRDAATWWYNITNSMANINEPFVGYEAKDLVKGRLIGRKDPGLLEGIAGIGLGLIASVSDTPPTWDETFLLS